MQESQFFAPILALVIFGALAYLITSLFRTRDVTDVARGAYLPPPLFPSLPTLEDVLNQTPTPVKAMRQYIHKDKYARHMTSERRREAIPETHQRVKGMHLKKYGPKIEALLDEAIRAMDDELVLPAMRVMQFAGEAIEKNQQKSFNCTSSHCDRPRFFAEAVALLMGGSGVGFSVQKHHVAKLPPLAHRDAFAGKPPIYHIVEDSAFGWADAVGALINAYIEGFDIAFDYSPIRKRNTLMRTSGGRAPGPEPLRRAINLMRHILDNAAGRQLKPIECFDLVCIASECVLSGGVRRSALICLFSPDDTEMLNCKASEHWYQTTPWRQRSNNSAVLLRSEATLEQVQNILSYARRWGDPGVYFTDSLEFTANPCVEIGQNPTLKLTPERIARLLANPHPANPPAEDLIPGNRVSGWSFCNLSIINGSKIKTPEDLYRAARAASIHGTLQAGYTDYPYLGPVSEMISERDALLGVSISGMAMNPDVMLNPAILTRAAQVVMETNREVAGIIGINTTARGTCIKPDGNSSTYLGCTPPGIHPYHAEYTIRSCVAPRDNAIYQAFQTANPHMTSPKVGADHDDLVLFAVKAPPGAITREDWPAPVFLEKIRDVLGSWIEAGTGREDEDFPGCKLRHNVSNTISVKDDEWDKVAQILFDHRELYSGVSVLAFWGDDTHPNAPYRAVTADRSEMQALWNQVTQPYTDVDYDAVIEDEDDTTRAGEAACAGGACLV